VKFVLWLQSWCRREQTRKLTYQLKSAWDCGQSQRDHTSRPADRDSDRSSASIGSKGSGDGAPDEGGVRKLWAAKPT